MDKQGIDDNEPLTNIKSRTQKPPLAAPRFALACFDVQAPEEKHRFGLKWL